MAKYNFTIKQGIKFTKSVTWKDSNNDPYDISDYTVEMQLRKDYDSDIILTLDDAGNGGLTVDGAAGKVTITMTDVQTAAFDDADFPCVYDLELTNDVGVVVKRLLEGTIILSREVTK